MPSSERPSTSNTQENVTEMRELVFKKCHTSLRETASELGIAYGNPQWRTYELSSTRLVQKQYRKSVVEDLNFEVKNNPPIMKRIIAGDET